MKNPGEGTVLLIVARPSLNLTQNAEKKHSSMMRTMLLKVSSHMSGAAAEQSDYFYK